MKWYYDESIFCASCTAGAWIPLQMRQLLGEDWMPYISEFNFKVLSMMKMIINEGLNIAKIKDIILKKVDYSYYSNSKLAVKQNEMGDEWKEDIWNEYFEAYKKDEYLGYYWFEFKINDADYRITMYVKDFDEGSGNIHVLPGMLQVWRKSGGESGNNKFFSINENSTTKIYKNKEKKQRNSYRCSGGISYQEGDWIPLHSNKTANISCCWNIKESIENYESIMVDFWRNLSNKDKIPTCFEGLLFGKEASCLYGDKESIHALYRKKLAADTPNLSRGTYVLYKWINSDNKTMNAFYRHIWVEDENAYFIVFDGENHILSTALNETGPNYLVNGKWKIYGID